jgi:hypothetical protein
MLNIDKQIANLYLKRKYSVKQISDFGGLTCYRVRKILFAQGIRCRSQSESIRFLNLTKYKKGEFQLKRALSKRQEKLKLAGAMIYWGEGTKSGNTVCLSNSDPEMIKIFLKFLREICGISNKRLRIVIHYYSDHRPDNLKNFWMKATNIPSRQFCRPFLHQGNSGSYKRSSRFGTVSVRYNDKKLLEIINSWIGEYRRIL